MHDDLLYGPIIYINTKFTIVIVPKKPALRKAALATVVRPGGIRVHLPELLRRHLGPTLFLYVHPKREIFQTNVSPDSEIPAYATDTGQTKGDKNVGVWEPDLCSKLFVHIQ